MIARVASNPSVLLWLLLLALTGCVFGIDQDDETGGGAVASGGMNDEDACVEGCDPLDQDCPSDLRCLPDGASFSCQGLPPETMPIGLHEACVAGSQACDLGLLCLQVSVPGCDGGTGCCIAMCDLGHPQCSSGTVCTSFFGEDAACYAEVGACVL